MEDEINAVESFAKLIQIDICDGTFTSQKTWPYNFIDAEFFEELKREEIGWPKWESVEIEIHLMVRNPENICEDWIKTGASSIVAHIEATKNFQKVIDICREHASFRLVGHKTFNRCQFDYTFCFASGWHPSDGFGRHRASQRRA